MSIDDPILLLILAFLLLGLFLTAGIKIGIALGIVGVLGFLIYQGNTGHTNIIPVRALNSFVLTAIPLFMLMGEILMNSGASDMIYRGASRWVSWAPGGLLHTNIASCAMFAAISGSSVATAATIGTVAIPQFEKRGYDRPLALGSLAAGGTLGVLIPPSINMLVYAALTNTSVGALFAGGIIPGLVLSLLFMIYIAIRVIRNPGLAPKEEIPVSIRSFAKSFVDLWPLFTLAVIVLGGIFGGFLTPTEAAAIGASSAIIIGLVLRRLTWFGFRKSLVSAVENASMALFLLVGASILAGFLARAGVPTTLAEYAVGSGASAVMILLLIYLVALFLGCFIDGLCIIVLTVPTAVPILTALGYDPVWFGVVLVVLCEIGMLTPPMGINLFVIQGISGRKLSEVLTGSIPFFCIQLFGLALFTIFPFLILWLPANIIG